MAVTQTGNTYSSDNASDTFDGSGNNDSMYGNESNDVIKGLAGADYIDGGVGDDNLDGGADNDVLWDVGSIPAGFVGPIGHDIIHGGSGDDTVNFRSADGGDQAFGDAGTDTINISYYGTTFPTAEPITFTLTQTGSTMYIGAAYAVAVQGFERLVFYGNIGADVIQGGDLDDQLAGAGSDDHLKGMDGDDFLDGGSGQQFLDGGKGTDTAAFNLSEATAAIKLDLQTKKFDLNGYGTLTSIEKFSIVYTGSGNDIIVAGDDAAQYNTNNGDDDFTGGTAADNWNMGAGGDTGDMGDGADRAVVEGFETDTGSKKVHGGNGNDWLVGAAGGDFLNGDDDADYISGNSGNDKMDGGNGGDTIRGGAGDDHITGGEGNDFLDGDFDDYLRQDMSGNDVVNGGAGNDNVGGGLGTDQLLGGSGDDGLYLSYDSETVDGGLDTADGGSGKDIAYVQFANSQQWTYQIRIGDVTRFSANGTQLAIIKNVETVQFSANADGQFDYLGNDNANTFQLGNTSYGNDTIRTLGGNDTVNSSFGSDMVDMGTGDDSARVALGGKDNVKTGDGNDYLLIETTSWKAPEAGQVGIFDMGAGKGDKLEITTWNNDINFVDGEKITLDGKVVAKVANWESLRLQGTSNSMDYVGSDKNEELNMQYNADTVNGMGGDDAILGGGGIDVLDGGKGSDTAVYTNNFSSAVIATLNGLKTVTVMVGGVAEDKIRNFENLTGGYGTDTLTGDKGKNTLDGWGGNDALDGGEGDDRLIGNAGIDTMTGGAGKDDFVFTLASQSSAFFRDVITDFKHGQDQIDLSEIDANSLTTKNDAFTLLSHEGAAFGGKAGEVRFDKQGGIPIVEIDVNGDKFADMQVELTGSVSFSKADFML
ncbi:MAG: hypothetical protein JWM58_4139 [Rhizobium sp.]|nr:hypothetical protein [Rhizobium sp.]